MATWRSHQIKTRASECLTVKIKNKSRGRKLRRSEASDPEFIPIFYNLPSVSPGLLRACALLKYVIRRERPQERPTNADAHYFIGRTDPRRKGATVGEEDPRTSQGH